MAKKNKISTNNLEKERFSNFVVDLRPIKYPVKEIIKKEKKNLNQKLIDQLGKFKTTIKKIKPNLLPKDNKDNLYNLSETTKRINLKSICFGFKKLLSLPHFAYWRQLFLAKRRAKNYWFELIRKQEKIFSAAPRSDYHWWRKFSLKSKNSKSDIATSNKKLWRHSLFFFILVLLLIILSFYSLTKWPWENFNNWQAKIINHSTLAVNNLVTATDFATQLNFKKANVNFQKASANFLTASRNLNQINDVILSLAILSNNPKIKLAAESKKFLNSGILASDLGHDLMLATNSLFNSNKNDFSQTLDNFLIYGQRAVAKAQELKRVVSQINSANLPLNYRAKFIILRNQVNLLADNLTSFVEVGKKLKEILGLSRDKRYLLVFQNNAEMRASGGFIGSYALVDLRAGKIINLEVPGGGSYDTAGGMEVRVTAPQPLWLVNPLWHFWDANWWPNWPTTAKNLMWFYEKSAGPSVDGVISVTPTVVERLLKITGPINLKAYGLVINADNFWKTVQTITEEKKVTKINFPTIRGLPTFSKFEQSTIPLRQDLKINSAHKPKKIIGDLMAKILEVLPQKLTKNNLLQIITLFQKDLSEKQILFYFTDPSLEATVASHNWAGKIQNTSKDYLLVVNTNIAGQKSDRVISQKIAETSIVEKNGTIINTLRITRIHRGIKHTPLTGVRNVDWLRVYVPLGSKLLSASGFKSPAAKYLKQRPNSDWERSPLLAQERAATVDPKTGTKIYRENGKTVFANWSMVDPGQSTVIILRYRLPFNFFTSAQNHTWLKTFVNWFNPNFASPLSYSLMVQKQPGASSSEFTSSLILPAKWSIFWRYPADLKGVKGWKIKDKLDADKYYVVLLKRVIKS